MLVLYITYVDFDTATSGSGVRPGKMYRAFLAEGHQVKLLTGSQERKRREERRAAVAEISSWLEENRPEICYIESPGQPILWKEDRDLIRKIHAMGIPIGYFYRDFYWRFPDLYPKRTDLPGRVKDLWLSVLQKRTDELLRCADIVYFPSMAAASYFDYRDMRALPPAGEAREPDSRPERNTCIYVGGLGGGYGGGALLRAFSLLNQGEERFPLILCCREKERGAIPPELASAPWLEIFHTSGDGLVPLYARASLAVLPVQRTAYTDFAVNVKLFEYLSYGLPIASTDVTAVSRLVRENDVGLVGGDAPKAIAGTVRAMLSDSERLAFWRERALSCVKESNLWVHRVRQVVRELTEIRSEGER